MTIEISTNRNFKYFVVLTTNRLLSVKDVNRGNFLTSEVLLISMKDDVERRKNNNASSIRKYDLVSH